MAFNRECREALRNCLQYLLFDNDEARLVIACNVFPLECADLSDCYPQAVQQFCLTSDIGMLVELSRRALTDRIFDAATHAKFVAGMWDKGWLHLHEACELLARDAGVMKDAVVRRLYDVASSVMEDESDGHISVDSDDMLSSALRAVASLGGIQ